MFMFRFKFLSDFDMLISTNNFQEINIDNDMDVDMDIVMDTETGTDRAWHGKRPLKKFFFLT
jgi:hypothetical protein